MNTKVAKSLNAPIAVKNKALQSLDNTPKTQALGIANYFIEMEPGISHLKLQNLTYCAYGWHFALINKEESLLEEKPQAWNWGPVFASMYGPLRKQEFSEICPNPNHSEPVEDFHGDILGVSALRAVQIELLKFVSNRYRKFKGSDLVVLTHRPGSPWHNIAQRYNFNIPMQGIELENKDIITDFFSLLGETS